MAQTKNGKAAMAATKNGKLAMAACKDRGIANVTQDDCEIEVASYSFIRDAINGKGDADPWPFAEMVGKHFAKCPSAKFPGDAELIAMHKIRDARVENVKAEIQKAILDGCTDADTIRNRAGVSSRVIGHVQAQKQADLLAADGQLEKVIIRRDDYSSASKANLWDSL